MANRFKLTLIKLLVTGSRGHYRIYDGVTAEDYLYYSKKDAIKKFKAAHPKRYEIKVA